MIVLGLGLLALLGLAVGSFLNVVIYRVPNGRSIVAPPSACPRCEQHIAWYDNIPVLSWILLRAKCRHCGLPISARYPLVEAGTSLFFVLVGLQFLPTVLASSELAPLLGAALALVFYLFLAAVSVALALIDLDTRRLPDVITYPSLIVGVVLLSASSLLTGDLDALLRAAIGCVALSALYFVMAAIGGMGMGDVKLALSLGLSLAWLGWEQLAVGAFAAFVLGGVYGLALLIASRAKRKSKIPFGPWMLAGAWVGIVMGREVAGWYLGLFGLA